jgi:hypothetical protein
MAVEWVTLLALVGVHVLWIAAPLLPAILIYWLFPSTTVAVSGPLANLTVKATGAFAAYLILFAATYWIVDRAEQTIGAFQKPYWTITAKVVLHDGDNPNLHSNALLGTMVVGTKPEAFYTVGNDVHLEVPEAQGLPYLIFTIPHFGQAHFDLREAGKGITIDNYNKTIAINDPIVIPHDTELAAQ